MWEIFRIVSEERKRREIDPTLRVIGECVDELKKDAKGDAYTRERLESMLEFLTVMTGMFEEVLRMPSGTLKGVAKLRGKRDLAYVPAIALGLVLFIAWQVGVTHARVLP